MNLKLLRKLILFPVVFGLLFTADVLAADITFSGRTFVEGV